MESNKDTILIIEDDAGLTELINEKIQEYDYPTIYFQTGTQASEWLESNTPILMILDYSLPDMNARDFINAIKSRDKELPPFIVATGQGDERIAVEMMKLGAKEYLIKDSQFLDMLPLMVSKSISNLEKEKKLFLSEQKIVELNQFNKQIIESAHDGIVVYDLDMNYTMWNPFMERLTGISANDVIGKKNIEVFPFLQDNGVVENIKKAIQEKNVSEIEFEFNFPSTKKSGWVTNTTAPLCDINGKVTGVITTVQNITRRKKMEEDLRFSEEKFRSITEQINDYISISDTNGIITYASPVCRTMFQHEPEEILGQHFMKFIADEHLQKAMNTFEKGIHEKIKVVNLELKLKRKDGSTFFGELNGGKIEFGNEHRILVVVKDITERKKAEEALKQSEEKYRTITENISDVVWTTDLKFNLTFISSSVERIFGETATEYMLRTPEEKFTQSSLEHIYGEFLLELEAEKDSNVKKDRTHSLEVEHYRADGSTMWAEMRMSFLRNEASEVIGILGVTRDITERKKAEEALIESENLYRNLVERIPDGVYKSTTSGKFIEVNPAMVKMFGYSTKDELLSIDINKDMYFGANHREEVMQNTLNKEMSIFELRKKDGSTIWVEDHGWQNYDDNNQKISNEGVLRDITERKKAEEALAEKMDELMRFHRLMVGRELTMIELKKEINNLLIQNGEVEKYRIVE